MYARDSYGTFFSRPYKHDEALRKQRENIKNRESNMRIVLLLYVVIAAAFGGSAFTEQMKLTDSMPGKTIDAFIRSTLMLSVLNYFAELMYQAHNQEVRAVESADFHDKCSRLGGTCNSW